jgi:hypothetical protein
VAAAGAEFCVSDLVSEAERALTPREDINLENLALTLSDGVVADQEVYERLVRDVGNIRMDYPEVESIAYYGAGSTSVMLEVDEDTLNDMEHGRYSDWNCLNRIFRADHFDYIVFSSSTWVLVHFDGVYQQASVAEAYSALPKIASAESEGVGGDGPTICIAQDGDTWHYMFDDAGGDCPAGCTEHTYYYFQVEAGGGITTGDPWIIDGEGEPPPAPDWVATFEEAGMSTSPYSFCR